MDVTKFEGALSTIEVHGSAQWCRGSTHNMQKVWGNQVAHKNLRTLDATIVTIQGFTISATLNCFYTSWGPLGPCMPG